MNNWPAYSYLSLATLKRDGTGVETPVWFASDASQIYCFSEKKVGKVKRLKNFSDVKINPCTATGKLLGEWEIANGRVVEKSEEPTAYQTLLKKYGLKMRLLDCLSWISSKRKNRAFIQITIGQSSS